MVDFGEVRSAAHGGYSEEAWRRLCELCEAADAQEWGEQLGPYVLRSLESWPSAQRKLPARWLRRVMEDNKPPACVEMATTLRVDLTPKSMTGVFDLRRLAPLMRPALRQLSLSVKGLDPKRYKDRMDVSGLLADAGLSGLRELELGGDLLNEPMLEIVAKNEALRGVQVVGLRDVKLTPRLVSALVDAPFVQHDALRAVRISQCDGINKHLAESGLWSGVTSLVMSDDRYTGDYDPAFVTSFPHQELTNLDLSQIRQTALLEAMLEGEMSRGVQTLRIDGCFSLDLELALRSITERPLRGLSWTGRAASEERMAWYICEQLVERGSMARLEALRLDQELARALPQVLASCELETLRVLEVREFLDLPQVEALSRARLPSLESLTVWSLELSERALVEMLIAAPWFRQLKQLHILTRSFSAAAVTEALAAHWSGGGLTTATYWNDKNSGPLWDDLGVIA
jgi:hypothetical protein